MDAAGDVGQYASLALDAAGRPRISYYDNDLGDLRYASFEGTSWFTGVVDAAMNTGQYTSLRLDGAGRPTISYLDATWHDLKVAYLRCVPLTRAVVAGPAAPLVGETAVYTATYLPPTASPTVTLSWDNGTSGPAAVYSWTEPGSYTVTVTATNGCGVVRAGWPVDVCQPVEALAVLGPPVLFVGVTADYQAVYTPTDTTLPVTVTWDSGSLGPTAAYSWTVPGVYTVTAAAVSRCGTAAGTLAVEVRVPGYRVYLPVVRK